MNNQLKYKGRSRTYDVLEHTYFRNQVRSPRTAVMKFIKESDQTVIDICTGTGANALEIAKYRGMSQLYGIDRSKNMLLIAKKQVGQKENDVQKRRRKQRQNFYIR